MNPQGVSQRIAILSENTKEMVKKFSPTDFHQNLMIFVACSKPVKLGPAC